MATHDEGNVQPVWQPHVSAMYVAFIDVLGFRHRIENDFHGALHTYQDFLNSIDIFNGLSSPVTLRIYSDALLVSSPQLLTLVNAVHTLNMLTLMSDCLVRGGIGYGLHAAEERGANSVVLSQALSCAVDVEKQVRYPCVALHESINIPEDYWVNDADNFIRPLLFFEGIVLVNPFTVMWGVSARQRVLLMQEQSPEHTEKYAWFLRLHEAVATGKALVPPPYLA